MSIWGKGQGPEVSALPPNPPSQPAYVLAARASCLAGTGWKPVLP
jgi:hypothetical protein